MLHADGDTLQQSGCDFQTRPAQRKFIPRVNGVGKGGSHRGFNRSAQRVTLEPLARGDRTSRPPRGSDTPTQRQSLRETDNTLGPIPGVSFARRRLETQESGGIKPGTSLLAGRPGRINPSVGSRQLRAVGAGHGQRIIQGQGGLSRNRQNPSQDRREDQ